MHRACVQHIYIQCTLFTRLACTYERYACGSLCKEHVWRSLILIALHFLSTVCYCSWRTQFGGTTIHGIHALEGGGLRGSVLRLSMQQHPWQHWGQWSWGTLLRWYKWDSKCRTCICIYANPWSLTCVHNIFGLFLGLVGRWQCVGGWSWPVICAFSHGDWRQT